MNVGVEHCGRDSFGIGKLFTYISPLSAMKELAQYRWSIYNKENEQAEYTLRRFGLPRR